MAIPSQALNAQAEIDALFALAAREVCAGRLAEAAAAYRNVIARRPDFASAYNNLANVLMAQGRLDEAAAHCQRAVALQPELAEAYYNLGNVLLAQGKAGEAAARFEQALALQPGLFQAYNNLGNALKEQGQLELAVAKYEQALALNPDYFAANYNLGNALKEQGQLDQAIVSFRRAVAINPHHSDVYHSLGTALKEQGKLDEAAACYDRVLALQPDHAEAHYHRREVKTFRAGDADLAALESLAADPTRLPADKMVYIHFALGKALEDVGDYPRAFEHLRRGAAMKRLTIHYDEAGYQRDLRLIAELFDLALLDRFRAAGDPSPVPIFIVGMPRCGTTLIEQILASHPQVHAAGELKNLSRIVAAVSDSEGRPAAFPAWVSALVADALRQTGQAYLASLPTVGEGKVRITDKMPNNFLRIGLIRLILPNARIIHAVRDPVDTCVSCFSRLFTDLPFSYDLGELGRYYRGYHELMAHWRSVLPAGAMLDVRYEDVVDNLEGQARRLIDYCGLPWDERCLKFHETDRPVATASSAQVRRPLYRDSLERWRKYEAYLEPLLAELAHCRQTN